MMMIIIIITIIYIYIYIVYLVGRQHCAARVVRVDERRQPEDQEVEHALYIYIYIYRERERQIDIYIYIQRERDLLFIYIYIYIVGSAQVRAYDDRAQCRHIGIPDRRAHNLSSPDLTYVALTLSSMRNLFSVPSCAQQTFCTDSISSLGK